MIYITKLEMVDENNNIVYRVERKKAIETLNEAILLVMQKEGLTKKEMKGKFWKSLDNEFKDYFGIQS
jgi:hypothetical protein